MFEANVERMFNYGKFRDADILLTLQHFSKTGRILDKPSCEKLVKTELDHLKCVKSTIH